jgi:hypothetical protein
VNGTSISIFRAEALLPNSLFLLGYRCSRDEHAVETAFAVTGMLGCYGIFCGMADGAFRYSLHKTVAILGTRGPGGICPSEISRNPSTSEGFALMDRIPLALTILLRDGGKELSRMRRGNHLRRELR